jgi:hypothetical protein
MTQYRCELEAPVPEATKTSTTTTDAADNVTSTTQVNGPGLQGKISITQTKEENAASSKIGDELNKALVDCHAYQSSLPHPLMAGEIIKMQVYGLADGKCKFTQTMPGGGEQICFFNDQQRGELKSNPKALEKLMQDESICKITGY